MSEPAEPICPKSRREFCVSACHAATAVALGSVLIEVTGDPEKIDSLVGLLKGFGIKELVRTGVVAMVRGSSGKETTNPREVPAWA